MQSSLEPLKSETNSTKKTSSPVTVIMMGIIVTLAVICVILAFSVYSLSGRVKAIEDEKAEQQSEAKAAFGDFFGESDSYEADSGPEEKAREIVPESQRGYLGIEVQTVTAEMADEFDLPQGEYVHSIVEGSGAADLRPGDVITSLNSTPVTSFQDLEDELCYYKAGETVTVGFVRESEYREIEVTLSEGRLLEEASEAGE